MSNLSEAQRRSWTDPEIRRRRIAGLRRMWTDAAHKARVRESVRRWAASPGGQEHLSANGRKTILLGRPGNPSRPERAMRALLHKRGVQFLMHRRFGRYVADFVIPSRRLILEVDHPRFHGSASVQERDARKDAYLRARGYEVRRVSAANVLRAVRREVNKRDHLK